MHLRHTLPPLRRRTTVLKASRDSVMHARRRRCTPTAPLHLRGGHQLAGDLLQLSLDGQVNLGGACVVLKDGRQSNDR